MEDSLKHAVAQFSKCVIALNVLLMLVVTLRFDIPLLAPVLPTLVMVPTAAFCTLCASALAATLMRKLGLHHRALRRGAGRWG